MSESLHEALADAVDAIGGAKSVGVLLWGGDPMDAAKRVRSCLDTSRPHKFAPDELVIILQKSNEADFHEAFELFAKLCGYEVKQAVADTDMDAVPALLRLIHKDGAAMRELLSTMVKRLCG